MIEQKSGTIVNVGSVQGVCATPWAGLKFFCFQIYFLQKNIYINLGAYGASKFAIHGLSDALRMELRPFGVDVVVLAPGAVKSELAQKAGSFSNIEQYNDSDKSVYTACYSDLKHRVESPSKKYSWNCIGNGF